MFVDRRQELEFLNSLLTRNRPGPAQLVLMYGRRRVGKSERCKYIFAYRITQHNKKASHGYALLAGFCESLDNVELL